MAILSPLGTSANPLWIPVSYKNFVSEILTQLRLYFTQIKFTKWFIFLREFLIQLENEAVKRVMEDKQVEFVEKNYTIISQLIELHNKYHKVLEQQGKAILEEIFPTSRISTRVASWPNGPAIRFYSDKWSGESNIVIYISGSTDANGMQVHMYTNAIPKDEVIPPNAIETGLTSWQEQAGKWRCWRTNERWFAHRALLQSFCKLASLFDHFLQARQSNRGLEPGRSLRRLQAWRVCRACGHARG